MHFFKPRPKPQIEVVGFADHSEVSVVRGRTTEHTFKLGPNQVSAMIFHADDTITDLGISYNLLTTVGRDLVAAAIGNAPPKDGALTASSATSATPAGGGMTVDAYKGWRVFCPVTALTTAPVYGNIGSNSATVLTVDGWWEGTADTMTGTTPAATNGYQIIPTCLPRFMALTENAGAAAAGDTVLTGEITTGGANRQLATYAHTGAAATFTLVKSYSISASFPAIHKMGLFTAGNATAAGILVFETVLNADANVISGDTLQVTDTVTLS